MVAYLIPQSRRRRRCPPRLTIAHLWWVRSKGQRAPCTLSAPSALAPLALQPKKSDLPRSTAGASLPPPTPLLPRRATGAAGPASPARPSSRGRQVHWSRARLICVGRPSWCQAQRSSCGPAAAAAAAAVVAGRMQAGLLLETQRARSTRMRPQMWTPSQSHRHCWWYWRRCCPCPAARSLGLIFHA